MNPITVEDLRRAFVEGAEFLFDLQNDGFLCSVDERACKAEAARRYPEKEEGNGEGV